MCGTDPIRLRVVRDADLPVIFEYQADPVAAAMAKFPSRDREAFDAHWARIRTDPSTLLRTIEVDGTVVGAVQSFVSDGRRLVGYWVGREFWGAGVATRALGEFLAVDTERPLAAFVASTNLGSMRVLEKCGFTRVAEHLPSPDGVREVEFVLASDPSRDGPPEDRPSGAA